MVYGIAGFSIRGRGLDVDGRLRVARRGEVAHDVRSGGGRRRRRRAAAAFAR